MKSPIFLALAATLSADASIVGWNFDNNGTVTGGNVAGIAPAANWNNSWPSNPTVNLIDRNGQATTLDISCSPNPAVNGSGFAIAPNHPGADADGSYNKELMNGYLNAGAAGSSSVILSEIPYEDYRIIVYFSSNVANRNGTVTLAGGPTYDFTTIGPATRSGENALLTPTSSTDSSHPAANYAVFTGLSGTSQTVSVNIPLWGGIAAVQVVAELPAEPEFGLQPTDQQEAVGETATFTAAAAADPAPTYQWEYSANGTTGWGPLDEETSGTLVIAGVLPGDEGFYRVVATNTNGSATSDTAFLDVYYAPPEIFSQPADAIAVEGSTVQLAVSATGYETLTYQWYKDLDLLEGETSDTLVLPNVDAADAGDYHVEITDSVEPGLMTASNIATVVTFPAWDGLVSHDSFDIAAGYTAGELPLQDPAIAGFTGPWTDVDYGNAEPEIIAGPLSYPDPLYLGSSGDRAGKAADAAAIGLANSGRAYRKLAPAVVVADNTTGTRYLSWLYRNGNENAAPQPLIHAVLALYQDTGGAAPAGEAARRTFSAGLAETDYGMTNFGFRYDNAPPGDFGVPVDADVHLFVVKFDLSAEAGSDSLTVWLDPALGAGEPAGGQTLTGLDVAFDSLALSDYGSNSVAWDEVRWGSSYDSVTLNPNPPAGFAEWIAGYDVGELDGIDDDADGDGLANGVENIFGTDPSAPNSGITQVAKSGGTVSFQHPRNAAPAGDLTAAYRWSADLVAWHGSGEESGDTTVTFTATPAGAVTNVSAAITGTAPAKLFTRLQVSGTP